MAGHDSLIKRLKDRATPRVTTVDTTDDELKACPSAVKPAIHGASGSGSSVARCTASTASASASLPSASAATSA